ncbi:MAG TPA: serine/threonine-protein kinase, partial [Pyrinomonadaceae bacterium]|nr:serine/threonine-protein kinase [Pyrinomonadaceae bacterium]
QILASLNHPNIARLLDGGVSGEGEPFLVMEYVEGVRIDSYCGEQNLQTEDRLRLFLAVCQGVSYAHQNLIVHRDIKPSNILVTAGGVPKLLDFGIAKLLDSEHPDEHTQTNFRAFTPAYASPEQARGERVTTASDVYSLGVLLQDLLHDTPRPGPPRMAAGGGQSENAARGTIGTNVATNQGDGKRGLKGGSQGLADAELNNIIAMARREEPSRRYSSVAQFAEDVERYLKGLPIRAQKDSFTYRAGKFIQRNKAAAGASALVVLSLIIGLTVALWQAGVARQERDRADGLRERAERRFSDVRQLSNALLTDIAPKIERLEGATEARQALVVQSLKYLDSLAQEAEGDLALQAELAAAYENVGVLQGDSRKPSLGDFRGAIASLEKAQRIRRRLLEINPKDAENRRLLADNLRLLAIRRMAQTDVEGGFRDGKEALRIYENLVAETPSSLALQRAFLETQIEDATNYINLSRFADAIEPLKQTAGKIEALRRTHPDDADTERILARCLVTLGLALSWEHRQPEAEAEMARGVAIAESLAARFPNDTNLKQELWKSYQTASDIYEEIDNARSFELGEKSRKVIEEIIAADRANVQARHNLVKTYVKLGVAASHLGKHVEALGFLERAMAVVLGLQEKDPLNRGYDRDLSSLYLRIGDARYRQRDLPAALAAYQKGAEFYEKQVSDDVANTLVLRELSLAYIAIGWVHYEYIKITAGQIRQAHIEAAKENYQRAVDVLLKAESRKALSAVDRKNLEQVRAIIEGLEKLR